MLPQAIAIGDIQSGIMAGKLNGVMPAQTPRGWRTEYMSMPAPTVSVNSPFRRCGMPQANSTTSRPRVIEPLESLTVLPCSSVMRAASSSMLASISSLSLNITRARRSGGGRRPGRECGLGRGDGLAHLFGRGEVDLAHDLADRRIVDIAAPAAGARDNLATNIVVDDVRHFSSQGLRPAVSAIEVGGLKALKRRTT